ncbi:WD40 repeat-like protein [Schizopora paradoxa]|uniref:WD repeat-containing protein JIP5 n=1 Tax=Schizopora paradoxa TaxID=27342 RepID=A0A0H2RST7_9AGAM|nr:WD40 repeat-like protein [Schizopora paradoxa]
MPTIPVGAQVFDLVFHPTENTVFLGLLTGEVKAFKYDDQGSASETFSLQPSKKSCRGLALSDGGSKLHVVGKAKSLHTIDVASGKSVEVKTGIHDAPINRIKRLFRHMLCTGDDDGVVKLWDTRQQDAIISYNHHFDFISDFMWIEGKRHVVATSGDGSLSVMDVRSSKTKPIAQSEDQEDELLSIVPIRDGEKYVVGTQMGILSIFNKAKGWGDCVDRVPGHPHSVDALCTLPSSFSTSQSTILTGSSDGLLRVVQLFPTKLVGAIADHGEFPIERIAVDLDGEGRWVGSVGHDEALHLTDLQEVLEDDGDEEEEETDEESKEGTSSKPDKNASSDEGEDGEEDSSAEEEDQKSSAKKDTCNDDNRKRKPKQLDPLGAEKRKKRKKGKKDVEADATFFSGL